MLDAVENKSEHLQAFLHTLRLKEPERNEQTSLIDNPDGTVRANGGRKRSQAAVTVKNGTGEITVNHRPLSRVITSASNRTRVLRPLILTDTVTKYDIKAIVHGGGITGKADALANGIAKAIVFADPSHREILDEGKPKTALSFYCMYAQTLTTLCFSSRTAKERSKKGRKKEAWSTQGSQEGCLVCVLLDNVIASDG